MAYQKTEVKTRLSKAGADSGTDASERANAVPASDKPLGRTNFIVMGVAAVMIILGFALMTGAPSGTDAYNPDIFSTRRIVVGPMFSFLGFVIMAVAIVIRPKGK